MSDVQQVTLEKIKSSAQIALTKNQLETLKLSAWEDVVSDHFIHQLTWYTAGRTASIETPATWWDHFKLSWFPKRLLKRFPPKMKIHHAYQLFPEIPVNLGKPEMFFKGFHHDL